jgi:hypothetical protein
LAETPSPKTGPAPMHDPALKLVGPMRFIDTICMMCKMYAYKGGQ